MNPYAPKSNFFKNTFCVFEEVNLDTITSLQPDYTSTSGSVYYYTKQGMYRFSNHWGRLANSKWRLTTSVNSTSNKYKIGFARWEDFYPDTAEAKIYYIEVDFETKIALYQHKNNPNRPLDSLLRTSKETQKRLKQIKNILTLTNWAKYFDSDSIDELRILIVNQLISTEDTLEFVKNKFRFDH